MPSALILIADGSEEIEFVTPYDGKLCTYRLSVCLVHLEGMFTVSREEDFFWLEGCMGFFVQAL
jgi:hypothetical protein